MSREEHLRSMVLEYLFPPEDHLMQVDLRQRVRKHILDGNINDAIVLLEQHFPAVLMSSDEPASSSKPGMHFVASSTVNPAHLNLNLRILAFTETFRVAYVDRTDSNAMSPEDDDRTIADLLERLQKLNVLVDMLPLAAERGTYQRELEGVAGLLAFPDAQGSPVARYLSKERRDNVASQINTAILYRMGHSATPQLELSTRYTFAILSLLSEWQILQTLVQKDPKMNEGPPLTFHRFVESQP
ncbi:hypothetical protein MKEN_01191500 [Mycena kentingensis (nom. inval.)]|nr:hypothetical protein MKEN_01191500 [Mycena kentingensis (nom. inval.)]